ncbi:MAG: hypothetical protein Kilf2KO_45200 [Rhodospirillales bacterium]
MYAVGNQPQNLARNGPPARPLPLWRRSLWRVDPGFLQLRLALFALAALGLSLLLAEGIGQIWLPGDTTLLRIMAGTGSITLILTLTPAPRRQQFRDMTIGALSLQAVLLLVVTLDWLTPQGEDWAVRLLLIPLAGVCLYLPRFTLGGLGLGKAVFSVAALSAILAPPMDKLPWILLCCALGSAIFILLYGLLPRPRAWPVLARARHLYLKELAARLRRLALSDHGRASASAPHWLQRQPLRRLLRRARQEEPGFDRRLALHLQISYRLELSVRLLTRTLATADALSDPLWESAVQALRATARALEVPFAETAPRRNAEAAIAALRRTALSLPEAEADSRRHLVGAAAALKRLLILRDGLDRDLRPDDIQTPPPEATEPSGVSPLLCLVLQGMVGVALSTAVDLGFAMEHGYWATVTVFLILSGSFGETVLRGHKRLLGTAVGVAVALLYIWIFKDSGDLGLAVGALLSLGLVVFSIPRFYATASIGIGFMVVAALHLIQELPPDAMVARIYETAIGAAIGILVAWLILPQRLARSLRRDLDGWLIGTKVLLWDLGRQPPAVVRQESDRLAVRAADLGDNLAHIKAEAWFGQRDLGQPVALHTALETIVGYLALLEPSASLRPFEAGAGLSDREARRCRQEVDDSLEALRIGDLALIDARVMAIDEALRSGEAGHFPDEDPGSLALRLEQIFYLNALLQIIADLAHAAYPDAPRKSPP